MSDRESYEKLISCLANTYESAIATHHGDESSLSNNGGSGAGPPDFHELNQGRTRLADLTIIMQDQSRSSMEQKNESPPFVATAASSEPTRNLQGGGRRRDRKVRRRSPDDVASWAPSQGDMSSESKHESSTIGARAKKRRRGRRRLKGANVLTNSYDESRISTVGNERTFVQHKYTDHSNVPPPSNFDLSLQVQDSISVAKRLGGGAGAPFPVILHHMLELADVKGYSHIVSWQPHGRAFIVHDQKQFMSQVMPLYFQQSRFASFQRQLSLYGFLRLTRKGPDFGAYYHELCLRGKPFLCRNIMRTRVKGYKVRQSSSPETEPDFYAMNFVDELGRPVAKYLATNTINSGTDEDGEQLSLSAGCTSNSLTSLFDPDFLILRGSHKLPPTTASVSTSASLGDQVMTTVIPERYSGGVLTAGLPSHLGGDESNLYIDHAQTVTSSRNSLDLSHTTEGMKDDDIVPESEGSSPVNSKLMAFLSDVDLSSESGDDELLIDAV